MAYSTAKVSLLSQAIGGQGAALWSLINSDSIATMLGAGYVTDAGNLGMKVGDLVWLSSGTFNTAVYPSSGAATADVGEAPDFTDTPPVRTLVQVGSMSAGAATLTDNVQVGGTAAGKVGFFGATPIVQPAATAQSAVTTTASTTTTPFGYTTSAQAEGIVTLLNRIRTDLVSLGIVKGSI